MLALTQVCDKSEYTCASLRGVRACDLSPVLLGLWLALHGREKGGGQLALFSHLQTRVAHFDVDDGEILQVAWIKQSPVGFKTTHHYLDTMQIQLVSDPLLNIKT